MVDFGVGTGIRTLGDCDAELVGEADEFIDYGDGVTVYALFRLEECIPVPAGWFKIYYWSGEWIELTGCAWHCPSGYYGYAYSYCDITNGAGYTFKYEYRADDDSYAFATTFDILSSAVDFRIRVLDDDTLQPIDNAYVDLTIGSDYTDADGYTQWWEVESGVLITGAITASGYEDGTVSITPVADATWNQYLVPEEIVTCDQLVKVVNKDTEAGIEDVIVAARPTVGTIIRCTTDSWGECTLEDLIEGDDYELVVESFPAGWECQYPVDCEEDITACTTERTFRLRWTLPLPCDQPVMVIDKDTEVGMGGITVAAWQSDVKATDCVTDSNGKCDIPDLNRDQMYDIVVETVPEGYGCEYPEDCKYNMQMACDPEITFKLKEGVLPTCEYTGHACDGKIADDDVPSSAVEGSTVEGSVTIDNLCLPGVDPEPTRYRVKFTLNGAVTYLGECVLKNHRTTPGDYPYEMLVPFTFPMPADDVTLIAEVEHCNESGEWESCEHADHIKTYTIELIGCEYTGYLCDGKIAEESVPESADEGDTVAGSVTIDNLCLQGLEHTRYRVKFTVDNDIVYSESFILKATRLSILEYPYEMAVPFSFGMPDHSVNLIVEIERCNAASIWEPAGSQYKKTYTISLKGEDEVEYKKALAYGAAAVGMYTGGSLIEGVSPKAKAVGLGLKVGTLIPAALCGLETYKIIKEKIPDWLK